MEADSTTIENDSSDSPISYVIDRETTLLDELSRDHRFFQAVMRPMLQQGQEGELLEWMKEYKLIQPRAKCSKDLPGCSMVWTASRVVDKYQWQCNNCNQKIHIRENSFFKNVYCSLSVIFKIILAWCHDMEFGHSAIALGVKKQIVSSVYDKIERVVGGSPAPLLGGAGKVLLVELYPELVGELYPDSSKNDSSPKQSVRILCLADTKKVPTQYWLHVITGSVLLQTENNNNKTKKANLNEEVVNVLEKMAATGGFCAIGGGAHLSSTMESLRESNMFEEVTSINHLTKHSDKDMQTFMTNGVWQPAIKICDAAQDLPKNKMQTYINCSLWRRQQESGDEFQEVVHLIADQDHTSPAPRGHSKSKNL